MLKLSQAVVVEGKYDKIKLSSILDALIIETHGFRIFKDKEKVAMLRLLAKKTGLIVITDSDTAGFKIRNYMKSVIGSENIIHVYIPDLYGKEKRKTHHSKEGKLGVEGVSKTVLYEAFERAGVFATECEERTDLITKVDFVMLGLSGGAGSSERRAMLLQALDLPERMTTNALIDVLNVLYDKESFLRFLEKSGEGKEGI